MVVNRFCMLQSRLEGVIGVLERTCHRYRWVVTEVAAAFGADDGSQSPRFGWWERINHDIFDPISMVTRTAAILEPIARPCPWLVGLLWFQRALVHPATPQTMRTL